MPGWMRNAEPRCVIYILRTGKEGFLFYFFNLVAPFGDSCWHLKKKAWAPWQADALRKKKSEDLNLRRSPDVPELRTPKGSLYQ